MVWVNLILKQMTVDSIRWKWNERTMCVWQEDDVCVMTNDWTSILYAMIFVLNEKQWWRPIALLTCSLTFNQKENNEMTA